MKKKETLPPISSILKYLLISYKNRLLALSYTPERSRAVACLDVILETEREVNHA